MFFPGRIKSISPGDRVLEVGPGGVAHPRSDVLLEKKFDYQSEAEIQRGHTPSLKTDKEIVYYNGESFPFDNNEFDYVICSHVLEHVENIEKFLSELTRIAKRGYLEFPTIYYDYIYNFEPHINFLLYRDNTIFYMSKNESGLNSFLPVNRFFYKTLFYGYDAFIRDLRDYFFQGFEWFDNIECKKTNLLSDITYDIDILSIEKFSKSRKSISLISKLKRRLGL